MPALSRGPAGLAGGFTLLEVILVLALLTLMAGLGVYSLEGLRTREDLDDSAMQFETALRMARADAAAKGRRLRIAFDEETAEPQLLWEPQPLEAPGQFEPYESSWSDRVRLGGARVSRAELTGESAYATVEGRREEPQLAPITFEPDGSCDSAVVELTPLDEDDTRTARIEVDGLNGVVRGRILTSVEIEEEQQ